MNHLVLPAIFKRFEFKLWLGIFIFALLATLTLQFLVIPHVFPQLHAGNGLLVGRDWVGFHELALAMAHRIEQGGWNEFLLRPDGDNSIIGVASFFYVVLGPFPWTLSFLSAAVFAMGGCALFSTIRRLGLDNKGATIAILPYVLFPSTLLQYGQIHKDVFCSTGVLVVIWSWVGLLQEGRTLRKIILLIAASIVALVGLLVFRPYLLIPFFGLIILLLLCYSTLALWQFFLVQTRSNEKKHMIGLVFNAQSVGILIALTLLMYGMSISYLDIRLRPVPSQDTHAKAFVPIFIWRSNEGVRSADAAQTIYASSFSGEMSASNEMERFILNSMEACRPVVILKDNEFFENLINRVFLKIAVARAGFTSARGTAAASNIDVHLDFCKNEDLIRYIPRALQIALFAPFPSSWWAIDKRNSSSIEIYVAALEMLYCYIAYIGMIYWLAGYRRWRSVLVVPVVFALGMALLLGLTVANVGTLYRMRFPYAMIFVSIGMAGIIQFVSSFRSNPETFHASTRKPTK